MSDCHRPTLQPMSVSQTAPGRIEIRHGAGERCRAIMLHVPADPASPVTISENHLPDVGNMVEPREQPRPHRHRHRRPCHGCPPPAASGEGMTGSMTTGGPDPETLLRSIALPQLALHSARQMACATCDQPRRWGGLTWCGRPWPLKPIGRDPEHDGCGCLLPLKLMFARVRPSHARAQCPKGRWPPPPRRQLSSENVSATFQATGKDAVQP